MRFILTVPNPAFFIALTPIALLRVLGLVFFIASGAIHADEKIDHSKLDKIKRDIRTLEQSLKGRDEEKGSLNSELKKSELASATLNTKISTLETTLKKLNSELERLQSEQHNLEVSRKGQQALIAMHIASAYHLGNEESIKLLLNQEDPASLSRTLKYYDYFLRARSEKLEQYRSTLASLKQVKKTITTKQKELSTNQSYLIDQRKQLEEHQFERKKVLAELNQTINSSEQQLKKLNGERSRLESILKSLEQGLAKLLLPDTNTPFKAQQGKLPWPVLGRLSQYYGAARKESLRWNGWLLAAKEGSPVRAIHYGRVIFSDYLKGHGLLIIIDHGDGYMSLYAHNQVLLKETGEWVLPNEIIAKVGNSGGQADHALYFEIRHNGKPTNPKLWLTKTAK